VKRANFEDPYSAVSFSPDLSGVLSLRFTYFLKRRALKHTQLTLFHVIRSVNILMMNT